jgi:hypothetical protein
VGAALKQPKCYFLSELAAGVGALAAGAVGAADSDFDSVLVSVFAPALAPDLLPLDEYKSAYQPPPLRIKLPPLMSRLTDFALHFGQVSSGGSEIF